MTDPNATTHARGNLFWDRQYTVRIATAYKFAHDITVGAVARYQDGQAFSRMVVVPGLNPGTDAIRAFHSADWFDATCSCETPVPWYCCGQLAFAAGSG